MCFNDIAKLCFSEKEPTIIVKMDFYHWLKGLLIGDFELSVTGLWELSSFALLNSNKISFNWEITVFWIFLGKISYVFAN